jgi:drug/metabolite transporter (DMT)-like permease
MMNHRWIIPLFLLIIGGAVGSVLQKALFSMQGVGLKSCQRNPHKFTKPALLAVTTFIGESFCLIFYVVHKKYLQSQGEAQEKNHPNQKDINSNGHSHTANMNNPVHRYANTHSDSCSDSAADGFVDEETPLIPNEHTQTQYSNNLNSGNSQKKTINGFFSPAADGNKWSRRRRTLFLCTMFAMLDLTAMFCLSLGLKSISASISAMFRGSTVIFSEIFAITLLSRHAQKWNFVAIGLVALGLAAVGLSSTLRKSNSKEDAEQSTTLWMELLGIGLTVLSSALNALQNTFEEKSLKSEGDQRIPALLLVGLEGLAGTLVGFLALFIITFIPGEDCGSSFENIYDTISMLINPANVSLIVVYGSFAACRFVSHLGAANVSKELSAVIRNIANAIRTMFVWLGQIMIFYLLSSADLGEEWDRYSWLQVLGFIIVLSGSLLYAHRKK